jgi:hypothetical protein
MAEVTANRRNSWRGKQEESHHGDGATSGDSYTARAGRVPRWPDDNREGSPPMQEDLMIDDGCGWAVAGVLTELEGAVLTTSVGDGGLAGTMELDATFATPANDAQFAQDERFEEEQG